MEREKGILFQPFNFTISLDFLRIIFSKGCSQHLPQFKYLPNVTKINCKSALLSHDIRFDVISTFIDINVTIPDSAKELYMFIDFLNKSVNVNLACRQVI